MSYLWIIITLIILIRFWTWILNQVFSHLQNVKKWQLFLWWALLVLSLFLYEWAFSFFWIDKSLYYIRENFSFWSASLFIFYGVLILLWIMLVFHNWKNKNILLQCGIMIFSLLLLALGWEFWWLSAIVCYYLLAVFTEESFKFSVSNNKVESLEKKEVSTLLLLSLLMGLSFSISENLLAFITQLFQGWELFVSMLFWRWLIASLIHCVATWTIALVLMKMKKWGLLLRYFVALLLGFSIHIVYNLSLVYNSPLIVVCLAVFAFIALTYLVFHIDELYMK